MTVVAALDCGTNSTRLLVAGPDGRALERHMRVTRLGEGVDATGKLDPHAIDRTVAVLADYRRIMDRHDVSRARLVATSAVRDAVNRDEFLRVAAAATGVTPELLSGDEEGRLAYAGATADLEPCDGDTVVVDIGGGSTELVLAPGGEVHAVSVDLGCVRLTERHFHHDPPTRTEQASACATIGRQLDWAIAEVPALGHLQPGSRLVGLAGTVSTLSALEQRLATYDRDAIHHSVLEAGVVARWCAVLAAETAADRRRRPGMDPGRADVIVGGAMVLREVMVRFAFPRCLVSESDILDGMVASLLGPRSPG